MIFQENKYLLLHSRPIGVQLALKEKNLVLWLDIDYRLNTNDLRYYMFGSGTQLCRFKKATNLSLL